MTRLDFLLAGTFLRVLGALFSILPIARRKVVLASARGSQLEGNLEYVHDAIRRLYPQHEVVLLLEPYSYGLAGKLAYFVRMVRAMYHLRTAPLVIIDNAYLPVHVAPHRRGTTVVQVWHAVGALKRFGVDTIKPLLEPERTFLHRHYDYVVVSSEHTRTPVAAALRTAPENVLALGTPRTDFFFDHEAMALARERLLEEHPGLRGKRVLLYAPTFRGRGRAKRGAPGLDAARLRAALPPDHVLVLKTHPNLDPSKTERAGYDVVINPAFEINELFTITDVLITDYSSSVFEYALLRRPLILLSADLDEYQRDPGMYLDFQTEMVGTKVADTGGVIEVIRQSRFDFSGYDAFLERHMGACDGHASERVVRHFLG